MALRHRHPILRCANFLHGKEQPAPNVLDIAWFDEQGQIISAEAWNNPAERTMVLRRAAPAPDGSVPILTCLFNPTPEDRVFRLPPPQLRATLLLDGCRHRPNAEVLAQGWANIGSALFGGLPATGAIARTATNVRAGGTTPVAGMVHAVTILLVMLVAAPLAGTLAMPALAALLLATAWNMSEPHKWPAYWAAPPADRLLLVLTMVLTVLADLTVAIGVGVALGLALRLRANPDAGQDWHTPER